MKEDPPAAATAETRRLAAIMFTDVVGFSRSSPFALPHAHMTQACCPLALSP